MPDACGACGTAYRECFDLPDNEACCDRCSHLVASFDMGEETNRGE